MSEPREYEIEVFRADTSASKGLTVRDVAAAVAKYDVEKAPAPTVKGHPEHDKPTTGIIKSFRLDGNRLFAKIGNLAADFIDEIKEGRWINRSMAFWSPDHPSNPVPGVFYPKHLGFLGAAQPAIAGMDPMKFSADEAEIVFAAEPATAVVFAADDATPIAVISKGGPNVADDKTFTAEDLAAKDAQIKELQDRLDAQAKAAAEARAAENKAFCDALVADGKLPPAHAADLAAVFNALSPEVVEFSAERKETPAAVLKKLLGGAKPIIQFGAVIDADGKAAGTPKTPGDIRLAAKNYVAEQAKLGKVIDFAEAVDHVSKGA